MQARGKSTGAGAFDGLKSGLRHGREDRHELSVAVRVCGEALADLAKRVGQVPGAERIAVAQRPGFAREDGQVVPGIVDRLVAGKASSMLGDAFAVEKDGDPLGVSAQLHAPAGRARLDRVAIVVEAHEAGGRGRHLDLVEGIEGRPQRDEGRPVLALVHGHDSAVALDGMGGRHRPAQATLLQPGVQLRERAAAGCRLEEAVAGGADLVLDLPLLPSRARIAGGGLDEVVRAELIEATVEGALAADEDRGDGRAHVVVNAAPARSAKEAEALLVGVEHHLLRLTRVGAQQEQAGVAEPDVGDLDLGGHAVDERDLVAPVELVGLARREAEGHEDTLRGRGPILEPALSVAAHAVVAADVALLTQTLEQGHIAQAPSLRLGKFLGEQGFELRDVAIELGARLALTLVVERLRARGVEMTSSAVRRRH